MGSESPESGAPWRRFLAELRRRRIYRVAVVYATTAFILIQIADLTFERLTLPPWAATLVIALALIGFPIAIVLAWAFEVTPEGVRRTRRKPDSVRGEAVSPGGETLPANGSGEPARLRTVFALATGVALLAAGGWWMAGSESGSLASVERLAVLPLANLMNDPDQEYFVQGMHDGLISELQEAGVGVIARTSVLRYGDGQTPARQIARQLDVDALVEGTVYRAGDSVEIEARLVDPATEEYLWRASFGGSLQNIIALHRDLTRAIAGEIEAALSPKTEARLAEADPVDPRAYEAYLKGVFHTQRWTREDLSTALEHFEAALAIDSTYAPAYVGIARVWGFRAQAGFVPARVAREKTGPAVERALALDSTSADAHMARAGFTSWRNWDLEAGAAAFRRAVELNPNHPETRVFYAHLLAILGRWEEAREQGERAVELDPLNPFVRGLHGTQLYFTRRYDEAIEVLEAMFDEHPGAGFGRAPLAAAYEKTGQYEEAFRVRKEAAEMHWAAEAAALERGYREGGYRAALRRAADTLAVQSRTEHVPAFRIAGHYASAGAEEEAIEWLERSYEAREQNMPYLGVLPMLETLHDDPRFRELARRVGVPLVTEAIAGS